MSNAVQDTTGSNVDMISLHWDKSQERRGLGSLISKANHIALTVTDIGRSLWFYSDVLGLQQIRRPNFDRHGAWLTIGNIELHLILGPAHVPSGNDLIVGHISLETNNIQEVLKRLHEMEIPFETNVSVPKGDESEGKVTQFFLRDPDGYYVEICNCGVLTDFCLGNSKLYLEGYEESGTKAIDISIIAKVIALAEKAKRAVSENEITRNKIFHKFENIDETDSNEVKVDEEKLKNLLKRTKIYGDVVQGETEESLRKILQKFNNKIPDAISYITNKHRDKQTFQPPTIYRNNEEEYKPPTLSLQ